jgi:hypothetical protein
MMVFLKHEKNYEIAVHIPKETVLKEMAINIKINLHQNINHFELVLIFICMGKMHSLYKYIPINNTGDSAS